MRPFRALRPAGRGGEPPPRTRVRLPKGSLRMFFFFSNSLGCLGSLAVTAIGTVVILMLLGYL